METIGQITLIGILAGVIGTGSGGVIALFLRRPSPKMLSFFLGFAAGVMLAIVLTDLLPEATEEGGFIPAILGLILGTFLMLIIDVRLPHLHIFEGKGNNNSFIRSGVFLGIGIALHNLPEGIAIGAGYMASPGLGLALAITIALHNIPEGIAMACPLCAGGMKVSRVFFFTALAGLPMGIGAFLGASLGTVSPLVLSLALSAAGGAMLYIIFNELIPGAHELAVGQSGTLGAVSGTIAGILLLAVL